MGTVVLPVSFAARVLAIIYHYTFTMVPTFLMWFIRYWIDLVAVPFANYYNFTHLASDGRKSNEDVNITRNIRYGDLPRELMDELSPTRDVDVRNVVLYVHGGGFVCVHRGVMNHSVTPLVRMGSRVFSIDYPLAPEHRYPVPVISVLKCLVFLRSQYNIDTVKIVGDSAGGCLASLAVGILSNSSADWGDEINEFMCVNASKLPIVDQIALFYTICDEDSWPNHTISGSSSSSSAIKSMFMHGWFRIQNAMTSFCLHQHKRSFDEKVTILDHFEKIETYPSTFLLCGDSDPLQASHQRFADQLSLVGTPVVSIIMKGFHGFHGLPVPFSLGLWRSTVYPANVELIKWLSGSGEQEIVPELPDKISGEHDFSILFVLAGVHFVGIAVFAYILYIVNITY